MKILKSSLKQWKSFLEITLGCIITALSINLFLAPYNIAPGGLSGVAIIINYIFDFPLGLTILALNIPLFIFGIKQLGGVFGLKTLYGTIMLSVIIDLTSWLVFPTQDLLLTSIFGGITMGLGLGIVFHAGGTTGGTDLAAKIIRSIFHHFSLGQFMFIFDICVVVLAIIVFKSYELGLYAIITLIITMKMVDVILEGIGVKGAFIISEFTDTISDEIINTLHRGVTGLKGIGMYTKKDKNVLMVVVNRTEIVKLKQIVKEVDKNAFIILTDFKEVLGEGFKTY